jgi:hypothetical protein
MHHGSLSLQHELQSKSSIFKVKALRCTRLYSCVTAVMLSVASIDTKYTNSVHVWKFGYHQNKNSKCVQDEHWLLVIRCVGCNQVPE